MVEHAGELPDLSAPALAAYVADARRLLGLLDDAAAGAAGAAAIDAVTGGQIARRVLRELRDAPRAAGQARASTSTPPTACCCS